MTERFCISENRQSSIADSGETARSRSARLGCGAVFLTLALAACGNAADMPVAAPGDDIVAADVEGVEVPATSEPAEPASGCPTIEPMTRGQIMLSHSLGPGPNSDVPGEYDSDYASDYYREGVNPLIPVSAGMDAQAAIDILSCFYSDAEPYTDPIASYLDADTTLLFRTGGHTGAYESEELALYVKDGRVTEMARALFCEDAQNSAVGDFGHCLLEPGSDPAFAGTVAAHDYVDPMFETEPLGLRRGLTESEIMARLQAKGAPEYDGQEGYSAPVVASEARPGGAKIVRWQQTGYLDDSVAGERAVMEFRPYTNGLGETTLQLRHAGFQRLCWRDGSDEWTTDLCP